MISIRGNWYDGRESRQTEVVLTLFDNGIVHIEQVEERRIMFAGAYTLARVSARLADTPRYFTFVDHGTFETEDNDAADLAEKRFGRSRWSRWAHILETKKHFVLAAALAVLVIAYLTARFGIPAAAGVIARMLPDPVYEAADRQTLAMLDRMVFGSSELGPEAAARVRAHLQPAVDRHPALRLNVVFRKGGAVGPNAFALPAGTIIFTDEMVRIAENDDELLSVFAHEIGHVAHRHAMRRVVQDALLSFAVLSVTGDASGVSELFLGLPVLLTEYAYSRGFEREADRFALGYLVENQIPPVHFADILVRIERTDASRPAASGHEKWSNYISTHPPTEARIKAFKAASP